MAQLVKALGRAGEKYDPDELPAPAAGYGATVNFEGTMAIATRFGLEF